MRLGLAVIAIMTGGIFLMRASIDSTSSNAREASMHLTTAACNNDVAAVRDLLGHLPHDSAARRDASIQALHIAATLGHVRLVRAMLDEGALVDAKSPSGCTALMMAAGEPNSVQIARLLLSAGADLNAIDSRGCTPLTCAAMAGDPALVELLLERGRGGGGHASVTVAARCARPSDPRPSSLPGRRDCSSFP